MRNIYPQLNREMATMEYKLQKLGEEGSIAPPAQVWGRIAEKIRWEERTVPQYTKTQAGPHTYIIQAQSGTMTVSTWWRCAFIALCMIVVALTAGTVYFYTKYAQLEQRLLRLYPVSQPVGK